MLRPRPRRWRWRQALRPLSAVYGAAVRWRNARYDRPGAAQAAGVPVISIGNITAGGTGKTPLVIAVVQRLVAWGRRPAILTRGYGARRGETADEVQEFHAVVPDVPVVVNPARVAGALTARERHAADCLVLDDGFQHRRLARTLDIVVIDALDPWGGGALLPAGRLREPLRGLRRAGLLVVSRCNQVEPAVVEHIIGALDAWAPGCSVVRATVQPVGLVDAAGAAVPLDTLAGQRVQPVCGIGNPATFVRLLRPLAGTVRQVLAFADHHRYTAEDVRVLVAAARQRGSDLVVTTRKDWGKLAPRWPAADAPRLLRLDVATQLDDGAGVFDGALRAALAR
jgi:tetraacyldisaccharide 4'-kinase